MRIVGFPAYNEERYIGSLVLQTKQFCDKVLVLDDGSQDRTAEIAEYAGAIVIKNDRNKGKGNAIRSIIEVARELNCDVLVLMDADGQHIAAEIPMLINPVENGYDIAIGTRHKSQIPVWRRAGQYIMTKFTNGVSYANASDSQSGFRSFNRKAISELELYEDGFAIESEILASARDKKLKIKEVPISVIYHDDGSTMNPVLHGISVVESVIEMIAERRPLSFFGFGSLVLYIIGATFGFRALSIFRGTGKWAMGNLMLSVLLIIVATVVLFGGIMLFAVSRWKDRKGK